MTSKRRLMSLFLSAVLIAALFAPMGAGAAEEALTLEKINEFLNSSADLGEGSKPTRSPSFPSTTLTALGKRIPSTPL